MSRPETSTGTELARRESSGLIASGLEWQAIREQANALIKSKFYPRSVDTAEKVIMIMLTGRELGIPPMQAVRSIHVVDGRPTIAADLMLALAYQRIPGIQILVTDESEGCAVSVQRPGGKLQTFKFGKADATAAGLTGKDNWKKYPKSMYRARAISAAIRAAAPDAILGLYTPEEIESLEPKPTERNITPEAEIIEHPDQPARDALMNDEPAEPGSEDGPEPPEANGRIISEPQRRRMYAISKRMQEAGGLTEQNRDDIVTAILRKHGFDSSKDVTSGSYEAICEEIANHE